MKRAPRGPVAKPKARRALLSQMKRAQRALAAMSQARKAPANPVGCPEGPLRYFYCAPYRTYDTAIGALLGSRGAMARMAPLATPLSAYKIIRNLFVSIYIAFIYKYTASMKCISTFSPSTSVLTLATPFLQQPQQP